jgi:[ribosomal protein S5]-alanine N-acetyltransferase
LRSVSLLSSYQSGDERALIELFTSGTVRRFLGGAVDVPTAQSKIESIFNAANDLPAWVMVEPDRADRRAVGYVILSQHHDSEDVEIAYALSPNFQGRGIASDAVTEALGFAFVALKLPRVVAETQAKNLRSIALLERVGMRFLKRVERFGEQQNIYGLRSDHEKNCLKSVSILI